jgi:diguanylate cyclase
MQADVDPESGERQASTEDGWLIADILRDLEAGRLLLAFQPVRIFNGVGGCFDVYSEALLRRAPGEDGQSESAEAAILALERMGMCNRLDRAVVWTVIGLLEAHPDIRLACNISAHSLRDEPWWRPLIHYLGCDSTVARRLIIEVTETSPGVDHNAALVLLTSLRERGVRIAVDDFGMGHGTLEFLASVRADIVKVDRAILRRTRDVRFSPDVLRNLVRVCADYARCVVVEGVESPGEMRAAIYSGADGVQGYHIERPTLRPSWLTSDDYAWVNPRLASHVR